MGTRFARLDRQTERSELHPCGRGGEPQTGRCSRAQPRQADAARGSASPLSTYGARMGHNACRPPSDHQGTGTPGGRSSDLAAETEQAGYRAEHRPRGLSIILLALIRTYQQTLSRVLPPSCRFIPSCSQYGYEAIYRYGVWRGGWLTIKRLARCHPLNPGGYDPVPDLRSK